MAPIIAPHGEVAEHEAAFALERLVDLLGDTIEVVLGDHLALEKLQRRVLAQQLLDHALDVRQVDVEDRRQLGHIDAAAVRDDLVLHLVAQLLRREVLLTVGREQYIEHAEVGELLHDLDHVRLGEFGDRRRLLHLGELGHERLE